MEGRQSVQLFSWAVVIVSACLTGTQGLQFVTEPSNGVAVVQRSFWFHCMAQDPSPVKYLWRFGEVDILDTENDQVVLTKRVVYPNGTLVIRDVRESDVGSYICIASAGGRSIYSRTASLRLAYIATSFSVSPGNQTIRFGDPVTFHCEIDSLPAAQFSWRLNDHDLGVATVTVGQGPQLVHLDLKEVAYSDAGEYVCVATNSLLGVRRYSYPGRLTVVGKPQIQTSPKNVTIPSGYNAVFNCSAVANPSPQLTWFKSSEGTAVEIEVSDHIQVMFNGTLVIKEARAVDVAAYSCVVTNEYGEDRASAHLQIEGSPSPPIITTKPENQTVTEGDSVRLSCEASGIPAPSIQWTVSSTQTDTGDNGELVLESITPDEAGLYTCVASSSEGQATASAYITVLFGPVFVTQPQSTTVLEGSEVRLPCQVTGEPAPEIQWISPESVVLPVFSLTGNMAVDVNGTLMISAVTAFDQGRYTCYARNSVGSISAVVVVTVEAPPHFISRPKSRMVLAGEKTTFSCHAGGNPQPKITWYRDTQEHQLYPNARVLISPFGDLTLLTVMLQDEGVYRCVAENSRGSIEVDAVLTVLVPPTFVVAPSSVSVVLGQTVQLRCRVSGVPVPTQRWIRDGETLFLDDNMFLDQNFTITIKDIRRSQLGQYTCLARNLAGQRAVSAAIHLSGQPFFTTQPLNTTVNVSDPLTLSCRADQSTLDLSLSPTIRWYQGLRGQGSSVLIAFIESQKEVETQSHKWATREGDLISKGVEAEDEGWYYCAASNDEGIIFSDPVYISVQVVPVIQTISNPPPTPSQSSLLMFCVALGNPDPEVSWRSPAGQEVKTSIPGYLLENGRLMIQSVNNEKDGGDWTCKACNMLGCSAAATTVFVEGKPVIRTVAAARNITTVYIACQAIGLPTPNITYSTEGVGDVNTTPGHSVLHGQMVVAQNYLKDSYVCSAENRYGLGSLLLTRPLQPQLEGGIASSREVTLTINTAGALGALPLDGVTVEYQKANKGNWSSAFIPIVPSYSNESSAPEMWTRTRSNEFSKKDLVEVNFTDLVPYTLYVVRVRLENVLGSGPVSQNSIQVTTKPDAPSPPSNVSVTSGGRNIVVTWMDPQQYNGNKDDIHFSLQLINPQGSLASNVSVSTNQPMTEEFSDLDLGNYSVIIATVNTHLLLSSDRVTLHVIVRESVPTFVPSILTAVALSSTSISVIWQIPENTAAVDPPVVGYFLRVSAVSLSSPLFHTINSSSTNSLNVTGLEERTEYNLSAAAFNEGGMGTFSHPVSVKTQFGPFSLSAYDNNNGLLISGETIAIIGGCIGGAMFVLLVLLFIYQYRKYHHGTSLNLLRPSHGLDPMYMENPKGLYHSSRWSGVRWLRSIGVYRVFGATGGGGDGGSRGGGCVTSVAGMDVAVVAVDTSTDRNVKDRETKSWWSRLRLPKRPFRAVAIFGSEGRHRGTRNSRLTISHPHFSGTGAVRSPNSPVPAMTSSAGVTDLPPRVFRRHFSVQSYVNESFGDGISLSSVSDSTNSMSADLESGTNIAKVTYAKRETGKEGESIETQNVSSLHRELQGFQNASGITADTQGPPFVNKDRFRRRRSGSLGIEARGSREIVGKLVRNQNESTDVTTTEILISDSPHTVQTSAYVPKAPRNDQPVLSTSSSRWKVLRSALKKCRRDPARDSRVVRFQCPSGEAEGLASSETVFAAPPSNFQTDMSPVRTNINEGDSGKEVESENNSAQSHGHGKSSLKNRPTDVDGTVTVTDGESVYQVLRQLDLDLERLATTDTQDDSADVDSEDSLPSAHAHQPHTKPFASSQGHAPDYYTFRKEGATTRRNFGLASYGPHASSVLDTSRRYPHETAAGMSRWNCDPERNSDIFYTSVEDEDFDQGQSGYDVNPLDMPRIGHHESASVPLYDNRPERISPSRGRLSSVSSSAGVPLCDERLEPTFPYHRRLSSLSAADPSSGENVKSFVRRHSQVSTTSFHPSDAHAVEELVDAFSTFFLGNKKDKGLYDVHMDGGYRQVDRYRRRPDYDGIADCHPLSHSVDRNHARQKREDVVFGGKNTVGTETASLY